MAFTYGFYNSLNGDRKYNAEQISAIFDGLIADGVYDTIGDMFAVRPGSGMQVTVGTGRAWFNHTWNDNDSVLPLFVEAADITLDRYDTVVLEVNAGINVRTNSIKIVTGTAATEPAKPELVDTDDIHQHPLAYIRVKGGASAIDSTMIQVVVGTSECPYVTGIIETASIDALFQQWEGEFDEWFENVKATLTDDVVTNLQYQIDQNKDRIEEVATEVGEVYTRSLQVMSDMEYLVPDSILELWGIKDIVGTDSKKFKDVLNGLFVPITKSQVYTYTSNGTHTIHDRVEKVEVIVVGGGGGGGCGGNYYSYTDYGGSGGNGGQSGYLASKTFLPNELVSYKNISITIGARGTGSSGNAGSAGGTSSFGSLLSAQGGSGGPKNTAKPIHTVDASTGNGGSGGYNGSAGSSGSAGLATSGSNSLVGIGGTGGQSARFAGGGGSGGYNANVNRRGGGGGGGGGSSMTITNNKVEFLSAYSTGGSGGRGTSFHGGGGGGGGGAFNGVGGKGGDTNSSGSNASGYGGGGGGGGGSLTSDYKGGDGSPGIVYVKETWTEWRYGQR